MGKYWVEDYDQGEKKQPLFLMKIKSKVSVKITVMVQNINEQLLFRVASIALKPLY